VRHYDNLVKPDLVAPGNKILAAEAKNCALVTQIPQLDAGVSTDTSRKMMRLNGTSMAAPVVSGAAALLLQINPKLTPTATTQRRCPRSLTAAWTTPSIDSRQRESLKKRTRPVVRLT